MDIKIKIKCSQQKCSYKNDIDEQKTSILFLKQKDNRTKLNPLHWRLMEILSGLFQFVVGKYDNCREVNHSKKSVRDNYFLYFWFFDYTHDSFELFLIFLDLFLIIWFFRKNVRDFFRVIFPSIITWTFGKLERLLYKCMTKEWNNWYIQNKYCTK